MTAITSELLCCAQLLLIKERCSAETMSISKSSHSLLLLPPAPPSRRAVSIRDTLNHAAEMSPRKNISQPQAGLPAVQIPPRGAFSGLKWCSSFDTANLFTFLISIFGPPSPRLFPTSTQIIFDLGLVDSFLFSRFVKPSFSRNPEATEVRSPNRSSHPR